MNTHDVKCVNPYFSDIWNGVKDFEIRYNDRRYAAGDRLVLHEYVPGAPDVGKYTDRVIVCDIVWILIHENEFAGLAPRYIAMSIRIVSKWTQYSLRLL
jgi:hypothetical protein